MNGPSASYRIQFAAPATRTLENRLPESVAAAVLEFVTGVLITDPYRVGRPLATPFDGLRSARRGTYRVLYHVDNATRIITVTHIQHRRDVYRR